MQIQPESLDGTFNLGKVEMDMFGGLKKTSSRITIATALGLTLGVYAMSASPAKAADFGGDCCADLEERVAELEATTVRKGNKKVSVTISGWVVKSFNVWDDGFESNSVVGDKDYDLGSRFAITGEAQISPGWSAGYNMTVLAPADVFGFASNQINDDQFNNISTLYSYMYIKSDKWGTLNWGTLSPASDNAAVLADASGTVIESNAVFFEGPGFFLRTPGGGTSALTWGNFLGCYGIGGAGIGVDCNGVAYDAVRYDSPTIAGFRLEASWGEDDKGDVAVFYNGNWGSFTTTAAYAYTHTSGNGTGLPIATADSDLHQAGATVMHDPSGLGLYGMYQYETLDLVGAPDTNVWYLKPFLKKSFMPMGATTFYGEYGNYEDQYFFANAALGAQVFDGSEVERYGLGVVQEIDAAAMHLFGRWQHQSLDADFSAAAGGGSFATEDWDLFQVGGVIFF
ncbi:porin [Methyloligella solikamskensis]|uniref:Porin n=1 Tax=Methyloligella solikamskensis TaxID=1177756 RepID=A0ABW3J7G6_9HYPH